MGSNAAKRLSFKFLDADLNRRLILLLRKAKVKHQVGKDGLIYYSPQEEEEIENDWICSLRNRVFPSWAILSCPPEWVPVYKGYMERHSVPFHEELHNGKVEFLLPRKYRPLAWKLEEPTGTASEIESDYLTVT